MTNVIKLSDTRWQIKTGTQTIYVQCLKSPQDITPGEYVVDDGEEKAKVKAFDLEECVYKYKKGMTIQAQQSVCSTPNAAANSVNYAGRSAGSVPKSSAAPNTASSGIYMPATNKKNSSQNKPTYYPVYPPSTSAVGSSKPQQYKIDPNSNENADDSENKDSPKLPYVDLGNVTWN